MNASRRRARVSPGAWVPAGSGAATSRSATTPGTANASRGSIAPSSPPQSGAMTIPAVCTAANVPMLRPRRSSVVDSASAARSSGLVNAFAAPWKARRTRNGTMLGVSATPNEATA